MDALIYNKIETEAQRVIDAVASSGSVIKVSETILEEPNYRIQANLPENWSELYDCLIAVANLTGYNGDYVYAPFSSTGNSGAYITNPSTSWSIVLVVYKVGTEFKYRGINITGSPITPGTADFFTVRYYNTQRQFNAGSSLTAYGFKIITNT